MNNVEHRIQAACVKWFRATYPEQAGVFFAIPNGGARSPITGALLKKEGVVRGVADLFLAYPSAQYHGLFIEMKKKDGRQNEFQKAFQLSVARNGYKYSICRSVDDFVFEINSYLCANGHLS